MKQKKEMNLKTSRNSLNQDFDMENQFIINFSLKKQDNFKTNNLKNIYKIQSKQDQTRLNKIKMKMQSKILLNFIVFLITLRIIIKIGCKMVKYIIKGFFDRDLTYIKNQHRILKFKAYYLQILRYLGVIYNNLESYKDLYKIC